MALRTGSASIAAAMAVVALASPLAAQRPQVELDPELPLGVERAITKGLEAPGASISTGDRTIGVGDTIRASVLHFGGSLVLRGAVQADVTAVGSEVTLTPQATIDGSLTVLGGRLYSTTMADVNGSTIWLQERITAREAAGVIVVDYEPPPGPGFPIEPKGFAGVVIHGYNGVDGLSFGLEAGLVQRKDWPRTELSGGPVFRTERDDVGWRIAGLRELPRAGGITIGGGAYRVTTSPEAWHRGERGNGLASLFFADDDRTYYERTGYELWLEKGFPLSAVTVRVSWRDEDFESLESRKPFSFFGKGEDWRENPAVDEGSGRSIGGSATWDRRDDPAFPTRGAWAQARLEHWGLGGEFAFDWAQAQARAYLPLPTTSGSFVGLRAMGGGHLGGADTLAPQFLYRLGGGSTVPGYDALSPLLTGDRMAFATATLHQAVAGRTTRWYLVGLASIGDAWSADQDIEWNAGFGGGIAIHGKVRYAGVFGVYGVEEEQWQLYTRLTPWF